MTNERTNKQMADLLKSVKLQNRVGDAYAQNLAAIQQFRSPNSVGFAKATNK